MEIQIILRAFFRFPLFLCQLLFRGEKPGDLLSADGAQAWNNSHANETTRLINNATFPIKKFDTFLIRF